jgi:hypothetical protein
VQNAACFGLVGHFSSLGARGCSLERRDASCTIVDRDSPFQASPPNPDISKVKYFWCISLRAPRLRYQVNAETNKYGASYSIASPHHCVAP